MLGKRGVAALPPRLTPHRPATSHLGHAVSGSHGAGGLRAAARPPWVAPFAWQARRRGSAAAAHAAPPSHQPLRARVGGSHGVGGEGLRTATRDQNSRSPPRSDEALLPNWGSRVAHRAHLASGYRITLSLESLRIPHKLGIRSLSENYPNRGRVCKVHEASIWHATRPALCRSPGTRQGTAPGRGACQTWPGTWCRGSIT